MKLVDLEQKVFIPIVDESKSGATYEVQMSVAEVFEKFFEGNTPQIVEAVPVEWLKEQIAEAPDSLWASLIKSVMNQWQKEQEAGR